MITPKYNKVVIREIKEEVTVGGIIMPVIQDSKYTAFGEVLAVGPGRMLDSGVINPCCTVPGEKVTFGLAGGSMKLKVDGVEYWVIPDHEIICGHPEESKKE